MKTHPFLLQISLSCLTVMTAAAADLPPSGTNTIYGVVRFTNADADILARLGPPGNEGTSTLVVVANSEPPAVLGASKYFPTPDFFSNPYALTVTANDVPLIYNVYADMSLDGIYEEYWTATLPAAPLTSNSPPAEVNIDECVALLELRYQRPDGSPVATLGGRALVTETATGIWRARYLTQPAGRTENFLVVPSGIEIKLAVEVDTGMDIYLDRLTHLETHTMTLACDETRVLVLTIPDAVTLGRITGNANLVGEIELATPGYLELLGRPVIKASGPAGNQRYAALAAEAPGADASRPFALENLVPTDASERWNVYSEFQFGSGYRFEYFLSPSLGRGAHNPGVTVTAGDTTDVADRLVMTPARLVGNITLTGPPEFGGNLSALRGLKRAADYDADMDGIPDGVGISGIGGSYVIATGVDELAPGSTLTTVGGQATASFEGAFNPATSTFEGDYEAVVGMLDDQPGIWKYDGINLSIEHPGTSGGPFVSQQLYITEDTPWQGTLAPGERATHDIRYGMAEVCLRIKSPAKFIYPRIINTYGGLSGLDSTGVPRTYHAIVGVASSPPYYAESATNEAVVTFYVPEGTYNLQPAISILDPDGGQSETYLPGIEVTVAAGERYCVEDCIRVFIEPPTCTSNFGFLARANAVSCDGTLTNLSLRASPLSDPSIRLGYSDIRILIGSRTNLTTAHGLFPEFDGFNDRSLYRDILYTATAIDTQGRVAIRQIIAHYDLTPPVLNCSNITVPSANGVDAIVNYDISTSSDGTLVCVPPSGSTFPVGATPVTCTARDLCYNTNTCTFQVIVRDPNEECALRIALTQVSPPEVTLTWDCSATLQYALTLDGPWVSLPGATSPYPAPADGSEKFFRLCLSGDCDRPPLAGAPAVSPLKKSAPATIPSP